MRALSDYIKDELNVSRVVTTSDEAASGLAGLTVVRARQNDQVPAAEIAIPEAANTIETARRSGNANERPSRP